MRRLLRHDNRTQEPRTWHAVRLWLAGIAAVVVLALQGVFTTAMASAAPTPAQPSSNPPPTYAASNHVLRVGWFERGKSFLDYENEYGVHQGLNPDYLHHIAAPQGVALTYRYYDTIPAMMDALARGDIDVIPGMLDDPARDAHFWVSPTYSTQQVGVVTRMNSPAVQSISALDGSRIASEIGSVSRQRLQALLPHAQFVDVESAHEGIAAVAQGHADAYVGLQTLNQASIAQHGLGTLRSDPLHGVAIDLHFLARRDDAATIALIQRGLASLTSSQRATIESNWLAGLPALPANPLAEPGPAQRQWLHQHTTLKIGIYSFKPPYDFLDDTNRWRGIGASILSAFAIAHHVRLEPVLLNTLDDPLEALRSGEVDAITAVPVHNVPPEAAWVSQAYDSVPWVLVSRAGAAHVSTRIGAQWWRVSHLSPTPRLSAEQIVNYVTSDDAIEALEKGEVDAAYVNSVAANRIAGELKSGQWVIDKDFSASEQIGFAVASGNTPLLQLLDDFIAAYSPDQLQDMARSNHPTTPVSIGYNPATVFKVALPIALASACLFAILLWAYRRVRRAGQLATRAQVEAEAARQRAEQADRAKSTFLATMSHEIRTPLSGIVGVVDILQTTPVSAYQRHYLDLARQSAKLLMGIINDILDLSRIDAGKLAIHAAPVDIYPLAEHVSGLYQPLAQDKGIGFFMSVMPHFEKRIVIDEMRILQILTNLLGNAIRFTDSGWVHVKLTCRYHRRVPMLTISVVDTGIGMPANFQAHLFESFVQADGSASRRAGGSGLGLSIVKRLVDLMHGSIVVDSHVGKGTRVDVAIPFTWDETDAAVASGRTRVSNRRRYRIEVRTRAIQAALTAWQNHLGMTTEIAPDDADVSIVEREAGRLFVSGAGTTDTPMICSSMLANVDRLEAEAISPVPAGPAGPIPPSTKDSLRILVAEDNDINRDIIVQQLSTLGVGARTAVDGMDALEQWRHDPPEIMLVDCQMPRMDGYELIRRIREAEHGTGQHTIAIAITANASTEDERQCLTAGMDDFLSKPLTRQKLDDMLRKWRVIGSDALSPTQ